MFCAQCLFVEYIRRCFIHSMKQYAAANLKRCMGNVIDREYASHCPKISHNFSTTHFFLDLSFIPYIL